MLLEPRFRKERLGSDGVAGGPSSGGVCDSDNSGSISEYCGVFGGGGGFHGSVSESDEIITYSGGAGCGGGEGWASSVSESDEMITYSGVEGKGVGGGPPNSFWKISLIIAQHWRANSAWDA